MEWNFFNLNSQLCDNLCEKFKAPTEIQQKVLVYTSSKVDLIIQARTGEGKTLCYAIPIVNYILNFYERSEEMIKKISPVALILVPTRELGVQVKKHIEDIIFDKNTKKNLYQIKIADVLGGFAKPKQIRILNKAHPEIVIATPGRLWEIIENEESDLLDKLNKMKFLVIDEADRMTETGHFKELKHIIEHVYSRIEVKDEVEGNIKEKVEKFGEGINKDEDIEENEKIAKKIGVKVEDIETIDPIELMKDNAKFGDIEMEELDEEGEEEKDDVNEENENEEDNNEEEENEDVEEGEADEIQEEYDDNEEMEDEEFDEEQFDDNDEEALEGKKKKKKDKNILNVQAINKEKKKLAEEKIEFSTKVGMRTILCSATIDQIHKSELSSKKKKSKTNSKITTEEQHFQNLIKNLKFYNKLIYLKLKNANNLLSETQSSSKVEGEDPEVSLLPSKLHLDCYKCDASTKDYYLYHLLKENKNSKIIIFTNSISHTKKLFSIFSYFSEFKCVCLHSKMLQNARIKNLEKFAKNEAPILFCTDVGARGLDIPLVDLVIHYHIPQKTETFIHRSGRTARANKEGTVSSLISEKEFGLYKKIMIDLHYKQFSMKTLGIGQLEKIKSLFEYAKQIEKESFQLKKANREKQWYQKSAAQCGMIFDDDDREEDIDKEQKMNEKLLNKKRKLINKEKFQRKKIYTKLNENSIKRSSFLTPDQVDKLNKLMQDETFKKENITQALYEARNDARAIKFKDKPKKRRYMNRRKGK